MFGIKLIILRYKSCIATFWICMDATFFSISRFFKYFLRIDATDRNKISIDQKWLFSVVSLYPRSCFANTPFKVWMFTKIIIYLFIINANKGFKFSMCTTHYSTVRALNSLKFKFKSMHLLNLVSILLN